jgi:hypothetical protein
MKPIRFTLIIKGEIDPMSTVTGTYTITTGSGTPPPPSLAINPAAGTEGPFPAGVAIAPTVLATVTGGTPPYNYQISGLPAGTGYEVNEAPSADGVAGDADITLTGTPTAADVSASPEPLVIVVTDSAGATAQLQRKL